MFWSWAFLAVSIWGAWFTWNTWRPSKPRSAVSVPSFFAGWLTSELAAHHVAWQAVATVVFVAMGALSAWPGWVGLGITLLSWAALLAHIPLSARTGPILERALEDALGEEYPVHVEEWDFLPDLRRSRLLVPFYLRDAEVHVERDLRYAEGAGTRHTLDVYVPPGRPERAPVLLQVHGGAWVVGDKRQQGLPLMLHMTARGWICVAINYRLSPKATWPDHLVDVKLALAWIREHIGEYGGDPDFVCVTGGSAGGHLTALAGLTANDLAFQPGFEGVDTRVAACVPFYGVYDFTNRFGHDHRDGIGTFLEKWVFKKKRDDDPAAFEAASPIARVHPDAPPFFVIHGANDSLAPVGEARDFARLLRAASKNPVAYAEIPGAQHAFEIFHSPRARQAVAGVERFLTFVHSRHQKAREGRARA